MDAGQPRCLDRLGVKHNRESTGTRRNSSGTLNNRISPGNLYSALMTQFRQEPDSLEKGGHDVDPNQFRERR